MAKHWLRSVLTGVLALSLWSSATATPSGTSSPGNPDRGVALFSAYCASCHGEAGQGDGPVAARLARDFNARATDFSLPAWQKSRSDRDILAIISGGGAQVHRSVYMPAWGMTLNQQEKLDLVAYLRELGKPSATGYAPAATLAIQKTLELGRTLYTLHCLACHGPRGKADGPRLQNLPAEFGSLKPADFSRREQMRTVTDEHLEKYAQSGIYHSRLVEAPEQMPWWHTPLNPEEIQALILYLRSLSLTP